MLLTRFAFKRVGARLAAAFAVILAILLATTAASAWHLWRIEARNEALARQGERMVLVGRWAALVRTNLDRALTATRLEAASGDDESVRARLSGVSGRMVEEMAATASAAGAIQQQFSAQGERAEIAALVARIDGFRSRFVEMRGKIRDDIQMGEGSKRIEAELLPLAQAMIKALDDLAARLEAMTAEQNRGLVEVVRESQIVLALASVVAFLTALALAWLATRSITAPVREAAAVARSIAGGDLTHRVESARPDEIGGLLRDLAQMQVRLNEAFGNIRRSVGNIEVASGEVAAGNSELSSRTEQAASSLQQTASSMEELAGTVRQTAESASTADELARSAAGVAKRGGEVVTRVVATMQEINASSTRIADIIGVIDGIAFQTNILALNAAVEAARAGDQGRGFAVVASEVRRLAQRAAEAAKEVKDMVSASIEKIDAGSRLVQDAGRTMDEIVASSGRVTAVMTAISAAARQESAGIGQVNGAVAQLESVTQQNAALVEQGAAAAESLRQQALTLADVVASFQLVDEAASAARPGDAEVDAPARRRAVSALENTRAVAAISSRITWRPPKSAL